jgi:hypothetical protein
VSLRLGGLPSQPWCFYVLGTSHCKPANLTTLLPWSMPKLLSELVAAPAADQ